MILPIGFAGISCKRQSPEIADFLEKPAVIIKFDIPKHKIAGINMCNGDLDLIQNFIKEQYPLLEDVQMIHAQQLNDTIGYYECTGRIEKQYCTLFVFKNAERIRVNGIKSNVVSERESRYEVESSQISIYKQIGKLTLNVSYQFNIDRIYYVRDDGFSSWE